MNTPAPASIPVTFPVVGEIAGKDPIVVVGPNGAGKSRLMRNVAGTPQRFISSQRRTFLTDQLPNYRPEQSKQEIMGQLSNALREPWQYSNEIDALFGRLLQEHYTELYKNNEAAQKGDPSAKPFVSDTTIEKLKRFWETVFVNRTLTFREFNPMANRVDSDSKETSYPARTMSDGERSCLYMAARILTADPGFLVIDEPELHMHRKLAIDYWNKLEEMRSDIRFVYVTHELHFALSRRNPTFLVMLDEGKIEQAKLEAVPPYLAEALLGAATLTINAQRIIFFEGVSGHGLAHDLFKKWIADGKSAALGVGSRHAVLDAGSTFSHLGIVTNAKVIGVIDRDHGPEEWLSSLKEPAHVLAVHEIESLFALPNVIGAVATHVGYSKGDPWRVFLDRARKELEGALPKAVAERVRARISVLLDGVFEAAQIKSTVGDTKDAHVGAFTNADWANRVPKLFADEEKRIRDAMGKDDHSILIVFSGKQALTVAATVLGLGREAYANIVLEAVDKPDHPQHKTIVEALAKYLPPREYSPAE